MNKKTTSVIEVSDLKVAFADNKILNGVSFNVSKGENVIILGRSGSGKSVTIKCLVGLMQADSGTIKIFGDDILNLKNDALNNIRLKIGFMFQNGALYDSMSVRQNLVFTLKHHSKDLDKKTIDTKIDEALDNVGLKSAIDLMPASLSGGMKKRIALARAILINPEIMLYDEPTSGLDTITAKEISELIVDVQKKFKTTAIIITHDMACAKIAGDRILMLKDGIIYAQGQYADLENSNDKWVKSFFL